MNALNILDNLNIKTTTKCLCKRFKSYLMLKIQGKSIVYFHINVIHR